MEPSPVSESRAELAHWMGVDRRQQRRQHPRRHDHEARRRGRRHWPRSSTRASAWSPSAWTGWTSWSRSTSASWSPSAPPSTPPGAPRWRSASGSRPRTRCTGEVRHTNTAYLTMVALDERRPADAGPPLVADAPAEQRRMREAELRRANRLAEREEILAHRARRPAERDGAADGPDPVARLRSRPGGGAWKPCVPLSSGRQRGPVPGAGCGSPSAEVSKRMPGDLDEGVARVGVDGDPVAEAAAGPSSRSRWSPSRS